MHFHKNVYFRLVKFEKQTVVKKSTAVFLMLLMLFINAVKLFHSHPPVTAPVASSKKISSHTFGDFQLRGASQNEHCAICDFKFAKDADVVETLMVLVPLLRTDVTGTPKLPVYISALPSISSGRAPPVL